MKRAKYIRECPNCKEKHEYCSEIALRRAIKNGTKCLKCTCNSPEWKEKLSINRKGKQCGADNPFFGKTHSEETKRILSEKRKGKPTWASLNKEKVAEMMKGNTHGVGHNHTEEWKKENGERMKNNKYALGNTFSEELKEKLSVARVGKPSYIRSEETKQKMRIFAMERLEKEGIPPHQDKGARDYLQCLNMYYGYNFQPKRFLDIPADADGYDEKTHSWLEYDSAYHKMPCQQKKDIPRQERIIKYFEGIGKPLNKFLRYISWTGELKTVYPIPFQPSSVSLS
jgi:hypothetical protein